MQPKRTIFRDLREDVRLTTRFWAKVAMSGPDDCWPWTAYRGQSVDGMGYGKIGIEGRIHFAHRIAWEVTHGPVPDGMRVLHRCDFRPCCNPAHLFLGTLSDNMKDMWSKGRHVPPVNKSGRDWSKRVTGMGRRKGESHPIAKLTAADVLHIRERGNSIDARKALAVEYSVTYQNIAAIVRRRTWKHV